MAVEYEIRIRDSEGNLKKIIPGRGFMHLEFVNEVNGAGVSLFDIPSNHSAIPYLEYDGIIEIRRRNVIAGYNWYTEWEGLYADRDKWLNANRLSMFRAICVGKLDLLGGETVAWPANKANYTYFTAQPAETVAKALVTHNAVAASATIANGRDYNTDVAGLTVSVDGAHGNSITEEYGGQNLLAALQNIAKIGNGDFDLVRTGTSYVFNWYQGQRGTDRSASVIFALQYKNMENPKLTGNRILERTRVVVLGQGSEGTRLRTVRTGRNYDASGRNRTVFLDTNGTDVTALQSAGDLRLDELEAKAKIDFVARNTAARQYGRDYFVGDLVGSFWEGVSAKKQLIRASVVVDPSSAQVEQITLDTENART